MIFQIPCSRARTYLDPQNSYLKICIQNNDTNNTLFLDHSAYCFINQLSIFNSSNLIEQISAYNVLMNGLIDFQFNQSNSLGYSALIGTAPSISENVYLTISGSVLSTQNAGTNIGAITSSLNSCRAGQSLASNGGRLTCCLPIVSNIFNLSDKFIPIGNLSSDIEIQILLENQSIAVVSSPNTTPYSGTSQWQIISAELVLNIVQLGEDAHNIVKLGMGAPEMPIYIHSNSFRYYPSVLPSGSTGNFTALISARFNSLKSLYCFPRRSTEINSASSYSISSRVNPNIMQYYWTVGSSIIPSKFVTLKNTNLNGNFSEGYAETIKAFHNFGNLSLGTTVGYSGYNVVDSAGLTLEQVSAMSTGLNSYKNGFAIACELEVFSSRSDVILHGLNTTGQNIFHNLLLDGTVNSGNGTSAAYTLSYFANFDCILIIENGVMRCIF